MKVFLKLLLVTVLIFVVAIVAAPFFVRQEQIQSFIENKVVLPDGKKLKLEGNIKFGIFPYMNVTVPQASIIDKNGKKTVFKDFSFGFNMADLVGKSIGFDSAFEYGENKYDGHFYIDDYEGFLNNGESLVIFNLDKPLPIKIKGNLIHQGNFYSLKDFEITNEDTTATGNLKVTTEKDNVLQIDLNTEINSKNIENLRRLAEFGKPQSDFQQLSGNGKVKMSVTTKGVTTSDYKANLNGEGNITVTDAAIYGIDLNEIIGAPQQTQITENANRKIKISKADSTFKINNGIVKIEQLDANAGFANATGSGTVNIPESQLNVSVDIAADLAAAKVKVPLLVYGSFDKIKFASRAADTVLQNAESITDLSKVRLKDVKINLNKGRLGDSINQLKDIGRSLGINMGKDKNKAVATPAEPAAPTAPAEPAQPAAPASMQNQ